MKINIDLNGVLRNLIQKFRYHYEVELVNAEGEDDFEYKVNDPIDPDDLLNSFEFNSPDEFENFLFLEYPLEIFGHCGVSYSQAISDLNRLIYEYPEHDFTVIGIDELGKSSSASLFFLAKNGSLAKNIKFIRNHDLVEEWEECDLWVTSSKIVLDRRPDDKKVVFFETEYNKGKFPDVEVISTLKDLEEYVKK